MYVGIRALPHEVPAAEDSGYYLRYIAYIAYVPTYLLT